VGPQTIAGDLVEMRAQAPIELPAIDEERLIRTAFRKALDANARSPLAYAKAILQKQLKREPSRELFEKAAVESLTAKPAVSRPIPPELLRPAVKQPEPIAPAVDPSDWIEVEF
jgi:hypothetical protein